MSYERIKRLFYGFAFFDDFILIYPLYAVMFSDRGLSPAQISSLFIGWSLTSFLLEVPSGSVADKYPRKNVILFATFIRALGFASWLVFPDYLGFLLGFVLWGASGAFISGTEEALVYDELTRVGKTKEYTRLIGRMESLRLTAVILSSFAATLFAKSGYNIILILSVAAILFSALPIYLLPKAETVESTEETKYLDYLREGVNLVFRNTKILFIIGFASIVTGLGAVDEYYNLFFREKGFSNTWIAFLVGFVFLFGALGSMLAHKLEDKKVPLTLSMLLGAGLLMASTLVPYKFSPVVIGLYVGFIYIVSVLFNTYLQREATDKNRATMTSVEGLVMEIFVLITFGIFALTSQTRSYGFGFQIIAVILAVLAVIYGLLHRKYNVRSN